MHIRRRSKESVIWFRFRKKRPKIRINTIVIRENANDLDTLHTLLKNLNANLVWKLIPADSPHKRLHLTKAQAAKLGEDAHGNACA